MKYTLFTTLLLSALALATPAPPADDKLIRVVIHYVDAPDCDVQCGANTTSLFTSTTAEPITTYTSTSTKYVIVTLQTGYGSTETLGYQTATTMPTDAPKPTY
ncbi:hypothetical protein H072_10305 [Dactylellina haptotyla CBS 200.50]|uniref:Uncharacterized protein n=1 Tax=Dactylellina haptotyla (strain CBS 200.50) TaxID=1284197 RepID=S8A0M7_DACHA|nr:hypothetical protein H072_10305 [Dactylellina haptotyla CBS 200.50]